MHTSYTHSGAVVVNVILSEFILLIEKKKIRIIIEEKAISVYA